MHIPEHVQQLIDDGALFVINHSGGKDSQAMTEKLKQILPASQVLVIHAELPKVDWEGIPEHIEATVPAEWPVAYCRANKTFFDMVERRFASRPDSPCWPSPQYRQCTSDLKRDPIAKYLRHYLKAHPQFNGKAVHCVGIRAEESSRRAKAKTWKFNKVESKAGREVYDWLPIHDMKIEEVFQTIEVAGQQPHRAYREGMTRLSCCFCIMASNADLQTAARLKPDLYRQYVEIEDRTGYTMSMAQKPLREVVEGAPAPAQEQLQFEDKPCFEVDEEDTDFLYQYGTLATP